MRRLKFSIYSLFGLGLLAYALVLSTQFIDAEPLSVGIQNKCTATRETDPYYIPRPNSGKTIMVRLTNEGSLANRCELTDVLNEIVWDLCADPPDAPFRERCFNRRVTVKQGAVSKPKLIVLYVHGWMHAANRNDENYTQFDTLVQRLAAASPDKQVLGIYIGWNGSTGNGFLDYFSFWSRFRVADRITQSAILARIVGTIGNIRGVSGKRDSFIAIGHSFGARMLFAAVNAPTIVDVEKAYPKPNSNKYQLVKASADAVLLLNPAFEASRYSTIDSFMRNEEVFPPEQPPLVVTVSTDNDWATKLAFPLGQFADFSFDKRALVTLGNYAPFYTHSLLRTETPCASENTPDIAETFYASTLCLKREPKWHNEDSEKRNGETGLDPYGWSVVANENQRHFPFIVAHTDKDVIDGHGGIWKQPFSDWIFQVVTALNARTLPRQSTGDK
ncbi:exported protein of unknown function [Bradyrhizobium sp. ORS 285]|uniref:hypothetical protein n=1 Tax=Bradyrhizobium sp. ORS 285 TaxID=115808 RepID=UPI000240614B|nr:hypothetical protein [Bradyrhizobium sp. ORS 285]CCD84251.1 exported hypothetical protein [Bradyrhizobium sp. ORS 285]SMX61368.1 exported protein of unknown function [Bradyrhizobium sp. ORS 285]